MHCGRKNKNKIYSKYIHNEDKKKNHGPCVAVRRAVIWRLKIKTVKSQPGNEDLSWGIFMLFGVKKEKNGFRPQKMCADDLYFFSFAIGCRLFIEFTSVACATSNTCCDKWRKKKTFVHSLRTQCKSGLCMCVQKFEYTQCAA